MKALQLAARLLLTPIALAGTVLIWIISPVLLGMVFLVALADGEGGFAEFAKEYYCDCSIFMLRLIWDREGAR